MEKRITLNIPFITSLIFTFLLHSYTLFFLLSAIIQIDVPQTDLKNSEIPLQEDIHLLPAVRAPLIIHGGKKKTTPTLQEYSDTKEHLKDESEEINEPSQEITNNQNETPYKSIFFFKDQKNPEEKKQKEIKEIPSKTASKKIPQRALTLADLFKTLPHLTEERTETGADGKETLIITQGDMKYYSFLKDFIQHMNNTFNFDNGPQKMEKWIQQKLLTKNTALSIVIDKQGTVLSVKVTSSSGFKPFDDLSVETVYKASPFGPIPEHFKQEIVRVELMSTL